MKFDVTSTDEIDNSSLNKDELSGNKIPKHNSFGPVNNGSTLVPDGYLIFNNETGWFFRVNGESTIGPFESYFEVDKKMKVYSVLLKELKRLALY
ncbi:hypothetical protein [Pleionea sediminis]|uniref:hypothetical protein n=1 Tax=Pleionea sediminis TaxID=2569479 RepID=UPI0011860176|nr:hypothetical protein [Pleionea sediminis]